MKYHKITFEKTLNEGANMLFKKSKIIIIAGAGRFGSNLAGSLSSQGYRVVIIDKNSDSFRKLPENFSGYQINADATDTNVLERAGIVDADIFIAVTDNDNVNCLLAQIAKRIYGISKVYMRLDDTEKDQVTDGFNINVIYPFKLSVSEFERLSSMKILEEI